MEIRRARCQASLHDRSIKLCGVHASTTATTGGTRPARRARCAADPCGPRCSALACGSLRPDAREPPGAWRAYPVASADHCERGPLAARHASAGGHAARHRARQAPWLRLIPSWPAALPTLSRSPPERPASQHGRRCRVCAQAASRVRALAAAKRDAARGARVRAAY